MLVTRKGTTTYNSIRRLMSKSACPHTGVCRCQATTPEESSALRAVKCRLAGECKCKLTSSRADTTGYFLTIFLNFSCRVQVLEYAFCEVPGILVANLCGVFKVNIYPKSLSIFYSVFFLGWEALGCIRVVAQVVV